MRIAELVPVRYARMLSLGVRVLPAAACDHGQRPVYSASTPTLTVQLAGDARPGQLRRLRLARSVLCVFDLNGFDESAARAVPDGTSKRLIAEFRSRRPFPGFR